MLTTYPPMPREVQLALGRIFRLMSRPEQPGDAADYERARLVVLNAAPETAPDYVSSWARDRNMGAQGQ
jgi:hypothetical protein